MISILGPVAPKIPVEESVCSVLHNPKREKKRPYREFLIQLNLLGLTDVTVLSFMILFFVLFCYLNFLYFTILL